MGHPFSLPISGAVNTHNDGQVFASNVSQDNAKVHYGNNINIESYQANYSLWPRSLQTRDTGLPSPERRVPKRKRMQDTDEVLREGQDPIEMAIAHLGELCLSMRHFRNDRDAQKLANWISVLVGTFEYEHAGSRLEHTVEALDSLQQELRLVNCVSINSASTSRRTIPSHVLEIKCKKSVVVLGKWEIRLDTTLCDSTDTKGRDVKESLSSLRVRPTGGPRKGAISVSAFFGERTNYLSRRFLSPTIIAYRTVDSSSEVFEMVRRDDVDGLYRLFTLQTASARDCDSEGRSLLSVSTLAPV